MAQHYGSPLSGDPFTDRRRSGIGGSDAGVILGVSPWGSRLGLWQQKRGAPSDIEPSERMVWGNRLEGAIRDGYMEDTGRQYRKGRFRRHPDAPFVIGHVDGETPDLSRILEIKTTGRLDGYGPDGSDEVPPHYFAQVQHYLFLTGAAVCDVAVLVGGREMHSYEVPRDASFQEALIDEERAFWQMVQDDTPPDPDGSDDAGKAVRRMYPKAIEDVIEATPEMDAVMESYLAHKSLADDESKRAKELAQQVQVYMGPNSRLAGSMLSASWPEVAGRTNWKAVAHAIDEAKAQTLADELRGEPSRRFSVSVNK